MNESSRPTDEFAFTGVRFSYAPDAPWTLDIPHLDLSGGRLCGIVGANGSGKSTLLKLAAGILPPTEGEARFCGRPLMDWPRRALARHLGYLPQECPMLFDYTVRQILSMGRYAHAAFWGGLSAADYAAIDRALEELQLNELADRPLSRLSGGERRRAWIGAALAQETQWLLLDEPTQSLDIHQAAAVMQMLHARAAAGTNIRVVLHDLNLAARFCDRLLLLHNGAILADGPVHSVLTVENLQHIYGRTIDVFPHPRTHQPVILPCP